MYPQIEYEPMVPEDEAARDEELEWVKKYGESVLLIQESIRGYGAEEEWHLSIGGKQCEIELTKGGDLEIDIIFV